MCLITEQKRPIKIRKDLIVFKDMFVTNDDVIHSKYYNHAWKIGRLETCKITILIKEDASFDRTTDEAYPFYSRSERFGKGELICIGSGFHSALNIERYTNPGSIIKCLIPKGSLTYKDKTGLIVSNQIIIKEIV